MAQRNTNNVPMPPGTGMFKILTEHYGTIEANVLGGYDDCVIVKLEDGATGHIFNREIVGMFQTPEDTEAANKESA